MSETIFRKKSIDKVSSPEQLNDYIHVANPGVWLVLGALIIMLIGLCVWGVLGSLDTSIDAVGNCLDGNLTCYVSRDNLDKIREGAEIIVDGKEYTVLTVDKTAVKVQDNLNEHLAYLGGFAEDDWVYPITAKTDLSDGNYEVEIVTESVSPISFVLN